MEDTLRERKQQRNTRASYVLILVLMEDTLRGICKRYFSKFTKVLILVLMEDTLRGGNFLLTRNYIRCLNPCFNGRYSQREQDIRILCIGGIGIYKTNNTCSC